MTIEEITILSSLVIMLLSFGMSVYGLWLQRNEVNKQNRKMIELLEKIAEN